MSKKEDKIKNEMENKLIEKEETEFGILEKYFDQDKMLDDFIQILKEVTEFPNYSKRIAVDICKIISEIGSPIIMREYHLEDRDIQNVNNLQLRYLKLYTEIASISKNFEDLKFRKFDSYYVERLVNIKNYIKDIQYFIMDIITKYEGKKTDITENGDTE